MAVLRGRLDALRFFLGLVRPYAGRLTLAGAALIVSGAVALVLPRVAGDVVDAAFLAAGLPALERVSLEAGPGECVALVGPSGAGKSTLASLLLRFHDPSSGSIEVDGIDLRRLRLADLRAAIGLVPQDVLLFGGTVAENIGYGRLGAGPDDVRAAAEAAQAHAFISVLPQGYDTLVGERGVKLSAGERQRIAIARVFLKDPAIVVLDEATSALDAESEHLVGKAFDLLLASRSSIVIAHRLATVRRAHRVVLLERGRVRAQGTHDQLLVADSLYRRFVELQRLQAEARQG